MKKIGVMVAASLFTALSALPLYAVDVKYSGEARLRAFYFDDLDAQRIVASERSTFLDERFRVNISLSAGIATGVIQIDFLEACLNDGALPAGCADGLSARGPGNTEFGTSRPFGGQQNGISTPAVRQAYVTLKFPLAKLDLGREEVTLGHGLILRDTTDLIAATATTPGAPVSVTLAYLKLQENDSFVFGHGADGAGGNPTSVSSRDADRNGYLLTVGVSPTETTNVGFFVLLDRQQKEFCTEVFAPTPCAFIDVTGNGIFGAGDIPLPVIHDQNVTFIGITADGRVGMPGGPGLKYGFEYDNIRGRSFFTPDGVNSIGIQGDNLLLDLALEVPAGDNTAWFGATYLRIQGANPNNPNKLSVNAGKGDYKFANILLSDSTNNYDGASFTPGSPYAEGAVDPFTTYAFPVPGAAGIQSNIQALKLHGGATLMKRIDVSLALVPYATMVRRGDPVHNTNGRIGWEFDLNAGYKVDENVSFTAAYGYFNPSNAYDAPCGTGNCQKNINKIAVTAVYRF